MRTTLAVLAAALLAALVARPAPAAAEPPEGTLRVTVQDQTGAVLTEARLALANAAGDTRTAAPDARGVAVFTGVPYGVWRLTVEAEGFQVLAERVAIARPDTDVNVQLRVAIREDVVVEDRLSDRPGSAFSFALTPEEIAALPDDPDEMEEALREMAGPGARVFIDGFSGGRLPPKNQIQQIRFRTNAFSAEHHHAGMVRVDVITRPGMSHWRGMANVGFGDDALNARHALAPEKGPEQRKRFTVSFGGPLVPERTSVSLLVDGERSYESTTILAALPRETFNSQERQPMESTGVRARVDHALGAANQLMTQYERRTTTRDNLGIGGINLLERAYTSGLVHDQLRAANNRTLGTKAFLELRVSLTSTSSAQLPHSDAPTTQVLDAFTEGGAGQSGERRAREVEIGGNVDVALGGHTLRAGLLLEGGWWDSTSASNTNGTFTFATLDDYLQGRPSLYTERVGDVAVSYGHLQAGWYLQDDFRVGRDLSIGVGLRQEVQTHLPDRWSLAPRAAFAWTPGGGATTMRGGWGLFYDWYDTGLHEETLRLDGTRQQEVVIVEPGYPDPGVGGQPLPPSVIRASDDLTMPTIQQASIGIERSLATGVTLRSDYMRLRGSNTLRSINANAPVDGVRPDPEVGNISEIVSTGASRTDRLTVGLRAMMPGRRLSAGLTYQWATSENMADHALSLPSNSADPDADWGPAADDVRHRLSLMGSVPLSLGLRLGFQVQGASGRPYTITTGTDDNADTVFNDRPEGVGRNSARGAATWNANMRLSRSFNLGGASTGPSGPGGLGGPAVMGGGGPAGGAGGGGGAPLIVEGGASRYRLDVHLQAFNLFNRTSYSQYVGNLSSPLFGRPIAAGAARRIEIGATFAF